MLLLLSMNEPSAPVLLVLLLQLCLVNAAVKATVLELETWPPRHSTARFSILRFAGKLKNFQKKTFDTTSADFDYDYNSIMHYGSLFFR